jgi:carbonic anhydrase/acetyltransferase-like protein (isoleucine patch superfamily)
MPNEKIDSLTMLFPHKYKSPKLHPTVHIFDGAQVSGDVEIGEHSSVWFNSVIRGDVNYIRIGERTNIQDNSVIHVSYRKSGTDIGNSVTIGHGVILHACTIRDYALVGMGSLVLDDAEIGEFVLLGAGSLVTGGTKIPAYSKAFGRPAKVVGKLTDEEIDHLKWSADHYVRLASAYK